MSSGWPIAYGCLLVLAIGASLIFWLRLARRDTRLLPIYIAALIGAFLGAKLVYLGAEGWLHWHDTNRWIVLLTGKSITGALLVGYAAVELAKHALKYTRATGDWFAIVAPAGIALGRVGCWLHGCCLGVECKPGWFTVSDSQGIARWPAAGAELLFNLSFLAALAFLRWRRLCPGQHFHLYLISYGLFRFAHEFARETPRVLGPFTGYQMAALGLVLLGSWRLVVRRR